MRFLIFSIILFLLSVNISAQEYRTFFSEPESVRTIQCFSQQTSKGNLETKLFLYNDKLYLNWTLDKGGLQAGNLLIQYRDVLEVKGGVKLASITLDPERMCDSKYRTQFGFLKSLNKAVRETVRKDKKANHLHRVVMLVFTEDHSEDKDYLASCSYSSDDVIKTEKSIRCSEYMKDCEKKISVFSRQGSDLCAAIPDWSQRQQCLLNLRRHIMERYLSALKNFYQCRKNYPMIYRNNTLKLD